MARTGITYIDVEKAASQLQGHAKNPTVDSIRALLGTGSKTTIATHLKTWRDKQGNEGRLPTALLALVTGLWERLQAEAARQIQEMEALTQQQQQTAEQQALAAQQASHELNKQLQQTQQTLDAKNAEHQATLTHLQQLQQAHAALGMREQSLTDQLDAQHAEQNRLHALAQQMQANLLHYQEAHHALRTEQQLAQEKQQSAFQQQLQHAQEQLTISNQQLRETEQLLVETKTRLETQQARLDNVLTEIAHTQEQLQQQTQAGMLLAERHEQATRESSHYQRQLVDSQDRVSLLNQQLAVAQDQLKRLQSQMTQGEDTIASLRHDNQFLAQEKATLLGYIQQLKQEEPLHTPFPTKTKK